MEYKRQTSSSGVLYELGLPPGVRQTVKTLFTVR